MRTPTVYLVGAPMGGTVALATAAKAPVDGVISLSGPANYGGVLANPSAVIAATD